MKRGDVVELDIATLMAAPIGAKIHPIQLGYWFECLDVNVWTTVAWGEPERIVSSYEVHEAASDIQRLTRMDTPRMEILIWPSDLEILARATQ